MDADYKEEENDNFSVLVIGFLIIIGLGLASMALIGFFDAKDYEKDLSSAVEAFIRVGPSREIP